MWCPKCKTYSAHRSHRAGLKDNLLSLAGYYPYRCRQCENRFSGRRDSEPEPAASPAIRGVEKEISSTRGTIRAKRKRQVLMLYAGALIVFGLILYFLTRAPSMAD